MLALDGIKVVDLTRYLAGPTLTMLLADLGADVVKVETLSGDPARGSGPWHGDESVYYLVSNRNKRSISVDLRTDSGREVVYRLIDTADVFVQNFRPGVCDAMGFDYQSLNRRNPGLVYCNISGFGMTPPGSEFPGFDQTAQALSGLMSVTGTDSTGPLRVGIAVSDSTTGVFGAFGVVSALLRRERTGSGCQVDTSLMSSTLALLSYQAQKYLSLGVIPERDGNDHPLLYPQGTFHAKNRPITIASGSERMWVKLCEVLGLDELVGDVRFVDNAARMSNRHDLRGQLERVLRTRDAEEWVPVINDAGIPCSPLLDVGEALEHPFTRALGMVEEIEHPTLGDIRVLGCPVQVTDENDAWLRRPPPMLGENSVEICRDLEMADEEITQLIDSGVLKQWASDEAYGNDGVSNADSGS